MGAQQAFVKLQEQRRNQAVLNGESSQRNAYVVIAVVCSIIVLLGLVTATLILRTITSPCTRPWPWRTALPTVT